MSDFADKIIALRKKKGVTQKDLAFFLSLSERAVQNLEYGTTPTVDTVIKLCRYYNVSADYLLGLSDEAKPPGGG